MDTSFKLVKSVLDDLYVLVTKIHGTDATNQIQKRIVALSSEYTNLTASVRNPIDYSDPVTRFAYVFSYVSVHSSFIKQRLLSCSALKEKLSADDALRVTCIGGGPGSEMLGLLQACMEVDRKKSLSVWILDREESWSETWAEIDARLESDFKLSTGIRQTDVTDYAKFDNLKTAFSSDIFIFSFFLSEIFTFRELAQPFFNRLVSDIPKDSLVIYIDNRSPKFTSYAEGIFNTDKFNLLDTQDSRLLA